MKKILFFISFISISFGGFSQINKYQEALKFEMLPNRWDEAIPLGNGAIGALIWEKDTKIRVSLDHAELWDLRPMAELHTKDFSYKWVKEQLEKDNYAVVQKIGDIPYEREPAPSKLPGAAIQFNSDEWGKVISSVLNIENAYSTVIWGNGVLMRSFVHATKPYGYMRFENCKELKINLIPPKYEGNTNKTAGGSVAGDDLERLGYTQGVTIKSGQKYKYIQKGWGGFYYVVALKYIRIDSTTTDCVWSISAHYPGKTKITSDVILNTAPSYSKALESHKIWWKNFWGKSEISIPDSVLAHQYYMEQYKFGSVARANTPPISLQAIWTADNGRLPPWKGDYHHDLNTQLSYWPAYSGNHLEEAIGYINHLELNKNTYKKYTKWYFGTTGLNVPGVTTLTGEEMGGWIQYSLSPTVSAWLAQHYYLHWRYSMDREFLKTKAYPWFKEVAKHLEEVTYLDKNGNRQLPISSSPEINNNSKSAWFYENTNYDLAQMRFLFSKASELAKELNLSTDAKHFSKIFSQFSEFHLSGNQELNFAKNFPYNESHRHFSHLMAIHPFGEIRMENGVKDQEIIKNSLSLLDKIGPKNWCGYSYAWQGNLKARAKDGDGAATALKDFATSFCSINSFHLNGDQSKTGKSSFTYRPFTLEGNFAFAAGIQEMLLQSYAGFVEVFPAIPNNWTDVSFNKLRAEGAFLINAKKVEGHVDEVSIYSENGGNCKLKLPFKTYFIFEKTGVDVIKNEGEFMIFRFNKKGKITLKNGYE